jgi:hypothetical protein
MAWSPVRRVNAGILRVKHPGDYATRNSNNPRDGTWRGLSPLQEEKPGIADHSMKMTAAKMQQLAH